MLRLIFALMLGWLPLVAVEHIKRYEVFVKAYEQKWNTSADFSPF